MNSFGRIFRLSIMGESHGRGLGVVLDGCPAGISLSEDDFLEDIAKRRPSKKGTTTRREADLPQLLTGVFRGFTTGAPITIWFDNKDTQSADYEKIKKHFRPGHADFTAWKKFSGYNDYRGGGHFSGRLTLALVVSAVVAKKIIPHISIHSEILKVGGNDDVAKAVEEAISQGDSIGGLLSCRADGIPIGLGEPFFDSVESVIAHLAFSIPAIKSIAFGRGQDADEMHGSEFNDTFVDENGTTVTNNSGGVNGGITNGNSLYFEVKVRPTPSISREQESFHFEKNRIERLQIEGRHDSCIALRVPVVLQAIMAIALADLTLIEKAK